MRKFSQREENGAAQEFFYFSAIDKLLAACLFPK